MLLYLFLLSNNKSLYLFNICLSRFLGIKLINLIFQLFCEYFPLFLRMVLCFKLIYSFLKLVKFDFLRKKTLQILIVQQ